jgi:flagellar basal-body rod modification protein FlgD
MASIGTTLPSSTASTSTATSTAAADSSSLASQSTFLQLLVAQLKNQDPTQPVQGTEFVTQLATFSDVEQNLAVRQDVDALSQNFLGTVPSGGAVTATTTAGTATNTSATDAIAAAAAAAAAAGTTATTGG